MGSPLQEERERRGWSQEDVAKKVNLSSAQISRIEKFGVKAAETPNRLVLLFGNHLTLDQICNPEKYAVTAPENNEAA